jgi:tetratricopeptide (TPR) repeat protein
MAGIYSRHLYANREALMHFSAALALGYPELAVLHQAMGDLHTLLGEYPAAVRSYESAAAHCSIEQMPVIERQLGDVYHRLGEWDLAESYYQSAFNGLGVLGTERVAVLAGWCLTCFQRGQRGQSEQLASQALEIALELNDPHALAQTHNILGILARSRGCTDIAREHLEQSLNIAETLGEPGTYIAILNNLALVYCSDGQYERAQSLLELAISQCQRQGDRHREAALQNNLADVFHAMKQSNRAMAHLKQAVTIFTQIGIESGPMRPEIWKLTEW